MKRKLWLVLLVIGLGSAAWLALRPKPAPPPMRLHPTVPQVAAAERHLSALDALTAPISPSPPVPAGRPAPNLPAESSSPTAPKSPAAPKPRILRVSAADLNTYLAGNAAARKQLAAHGVEAVSVAFMEPSSLILHAAVRVRGHMQNAEISGTLAPDPKTVLRFTATGAKVGRLLLPPRAVTRQAGIYASRLLGARLRRVTLSVQHVSVEQNTLVLIAVPIKPASPQSRSPQSASPAHR